MVFKQDNEPNSVGAATGVNESTGAPQRGKRGAEARQRTASSIDTPAEARSSREMPFRDAVEMAKRLQAAGVTASAPENLTPSHKIHQSDTQPDQVSKTTPAVSDEATRIQETRSIDVEALAEKIRIAQMAASQSDDLKPLHGIPAALRQTGTNRTPIG